MDGRFETEYTLKSAYLPPLLSAAGVAVLAGLVLSLAARSPGVSEALLWRVDALQPLPSLTQRVFERRLTAHQLGQDRLVPASAVLFFGDSHVSSLPLGGLRQAYNFAIGGESAHRLVDRMPQYSALVQARAVVLGTGTNDLLEGRTPSQIESDWTRLLALVPSPARVVCIGMPLGATALSRPQDCEDADRRIAALCQGRGHAYVPLQAQGPDPSRFAGDGLHLNRDASLDLLRRIGAVLESPL